VIGDLFRPDERGLAVALYNTAPLLGPSLGPMLGAVVTQYLSWPWIFYILSIADTVLLISSFPLLRETYAPVLLAPQQPPQDASNYNRKQPVSQRLSAVAKVLAQSTWRPLRMLFTQPVVQILALFLAYLYGTMYLVLSTFPTLWVERYHENVVIGGLNYLSLGLGYLLGSQVCAFSMDKIHRILRTRDNDYGKPECKPPLAIFSAFLVPAGLSIYAWCSQYRTFWLSPDVSATLFAMGVIIGTQCVTNYLIDTYSVYTASAIGAVALLRGFAGFGFPLFAPYLYANSDYGWGNSLLAFIATFVGMSAAVGLWFFGQALRRRSTFCAG